MADEGGDLLDLLDGVFDAARRVEQLQPVAEPCQHFARGALGEAAGDHEVGLQIDHGLSVGSVVTEGAGGVGHEGQGRVGGVGRQGNDLPGVGEREQQFVGAKVDRDDSRRNARLRGGQPGPASQCGTEKDGDERAFRGRFALRVACASFTPWPFRRGSRTGPGHIP